jgi:hypothetical protein
MSSHPNRNFVLAYIFLVGLPVVGLLGVLKNGRTLRAPHSIDGIWQFQADADQLALLPCGRVFAENPNLALAVSQSGKNFTLTIVNGPKARASGVLDGTTVKASIAASTEWPQENCGTDRKLTLLATLDPTAQPPSLSGEISVPNCAECKAVPFRAARQSQPARKASR